MSISADDCDECVYLGSNGEQVATAPLRCCACRDTIQVGHRYQDGYYYREAFDEDDEEIGDGDEVVTEELPQCLRCHAVYLHLQALLRGTGEWCAWELDCGHDYWERWEREPPPEIAELAFVSGADLQVRT